MDLDKKRGIMIIICLVLLLGIIDASYFFFYYNQTITGNVVGSGERLNYNITQFSSILSVNTSKGASSNSTIMRITNLNENLDVSFDADVNKINRSSDCLDFANDCEVILTHILPNGTRKSLTSGSTSSEPSLKDTTFLNGTNQIEYNLSCKENSCPQTVIFNLTITTKN
jgi:hypothetical protein